LVGLRHLDGGLAHHHCQHYHHQFGVDDFADEAALPLKIECIGATLTVALLSKVPLRLKTRLVFAQCVLTTMQIKRTLYWSAHMALSARHICSLPLIPQTLPAEYEFVVKRPKNFPFLSTKTGLFDVYSLQAE